MKLKKYMASLLTLVLTAAVLFGVSSVLQPVAAKNEQKEREKIMALLLPGGETFTEEAYEGEDANITAVFKSETGYVIETTVTGYVDSIKMFVGVNNEGSVTGTMVLEMAETSGLGQRAMTDMTFLSQFVGTKGEAELGTNVDALSGATVTSKAVVKAVISAAAFVTGADVSSGATEWEG